MYMYNFLGQLFIIQYELGPTYLLKQINPWFKLDDVNTQFTVRNTLILSTIFPPIFKVKGMTRAFEKFNFEHSVPF